MNGLRIIVDPGCIFHKDYMLKSRLEFKLGDQFDIN